MSHDREAAVGVVRETFCDAQAEEGSEVQEEVRRRAMFAYLDQVEIVCESEQRQRKRQMWHQRHSWTIGNEDDRHGQVRACAYASRD
jgi:hypothetical protein